MFSFSIGSRRALQETDLNSVASTPQSISRNWWSLKGSISHRSEASQVTDLQQKFSLAKFLVVVTANSGTPSPVILSQVYGGPLRSVHKVLIGGYPSLLLEFLHEHHAENFRSYIDSRKCTVNGVRSIQSEVTQYHLELVKPRPSAIQKVFTRRTLEISRVAASESYRPLMVSRNINPVHLQKVFGMFGEILEVRPMFLKGKVGFVIEFSDMDSAIKAKEKFDDEVAFIAQQSEKEVGGDVKAPKAPLEKRIFHGLHEWSLLYTRDHSERNSCH